MRVTIILCFALLADQAYAQEWFPLEVGNRWEFAGRIQPPFSFPIPVSAGTIEVTGLSDSGWFLLAGAPADSVRFDSSGNLLARLDGANQVLLDFSLPNGSSYFFVGGGDSTRVTVSRSTETYTPVGRFSYTITFSAEPLRTLDAGWALTLDRHAGPVQRVNGMGEMGQLLRAELSGQVAHGTRLTSTLTTDKPAYEAGELIRFTLRIDNFSGVYQELDAAGNSPTYLAAGISLGHQAIIPEVYPVEFVPGSWREWTWVHDPVVLGLGGSDSLHTATAFYGLARATASFRAPPHLGGWLSAHFDQSVPPAQVEEIRQALGVQVIESEIRNGRLTETWSITGRSLVDILMEYDGYPGLSLDTYRYMHNAQLESTAVEDPAQPVLAALSVYPNPAGSAVTFAWGPGPAEVTVVDLLGRAIITTRGAGNVRVETDRMAPGVYGYVVKQSSGTRRGVFVVR